MKTLFILESLKYYFYFYGYIIIYVFKRKFFECCDQSKA